jgi:hypothetical protein
MLADSAMDSAAMTDTNEQLAISLNVFFWESLSKLRNFVVVCRLAMSRDGDGIYHRRVSEIQKNQCEPVR